MDQESIHLCWQKYVGFPHPNPSSPHRMSSMFALDQTSAATTRASELSSPRVSHITHPQLFSIILYSFAAIWNYIISQQNGCGGILFLFCTACGSTIMADDVGGDIASPNYPYPYPNNQQCSWIIVAQETCA